MVKNKRGWIRILEATISVMIITGVMMAIYAQHTTVRKTNSQYFYNLQTQILSEISSQTTLRFNVLNAVDDNPNDSNFSAINYFINEKVPNSVGYSIRICKLTLEKGFCKMNPSAYIITRNKNVFVQSVIISSGIRDGEKVYDPKKLRLFVWEK